MKKTVKIIILFLIFSVSYFYFSEAESLQQMYQEAEKLVTNKNYEQAKIICKQMLGLNSNLSPVYNLLARIALEEQDIAQAVGYFNKSIEISPNQKPVYFVLANIFYAQGQFDQALAIIEKALDYYPEDSQFNFYAGLITLFNKQDPIKSLSFFQKAEKNGMGSPRFFYLLSINYLLVGNRYRCLEYITSLREMGRNDLASDIERIILNSSQGNKLPVANLINTYNQEVEKEKTISPKTEHKIKYTFTPAPIKVFGSGTVTIKTQLKPK